MHHPGKFTTALVMTVSAAFLACAAHAQVERSGGGGEAARIMQQYQQVAA
jgi:hypothetical protein